MVSSLQSAICIIIELLLIFSEKNFMEVPKIHEIHKLCSPQKRHPTVGYLPHIWLLLHVPHTCLEKRCELVSSKK